MNREYDDKIIHFSNLLHESGLMEGKMGASLYFFILGKTQGKEHFTKQAELLLDDVLNNISGDCQMNFGEGIAGIGWGIDFLTRNNLVAGDIDVILEDVDNQVLKILTTNSLLNISFFDGLSGYLLYIIQRLKSIGKDKNTLSFDLNRELLILILNQLENILSSSENSIIDDIHFDFFQDYPYLIRLLRYAYDLHLYNTKIERMTYSLFPYFETSMHGLNTNKLHLALEIMLLGDKMPFGRNERLIDNLLYTTDFNKTLHEVDLQSVGFRNGLSGLMYIFQATVQSLSLNNQYRKKAYQVLSSLPKIELNLPKEDDELFVHKICLSSGIMGADIYKSLILTKKNQTHNIYPFLI